MRNNLIKSEFKYPKLLFLYWGGFSLSFLNYLTILSFNKYNPEYKIVIFTPVNATNKITWVTNEQKVKYNGPNYLDKLFKIHNVNQMYVDFSKLNIQHDASEV